MKNRTYKILDYFWIIFAIIIFIASVKYLNDGTLAGKVSSLGIWAPLVIILLKASTLVFAPLGGSPLYVIAGALYGIKYGFLICFIGDLLGSSLCFLIGRKYGMRAVRFFAGSQNAEKVGKAAGLLHNSKSFIKARIAFITIPELVAYAASLSKISFKKFTLLHTPFSIPTIFIFVFLGSTIVYFTASYAVYISIATIVLASIGIWALSKDYKKIEGM